MVDVGIIGGRPLHGSEPKPPGQPCDLADLGDDAYSFNHLICAAGDCLYSNTGLGSDPRDMFCGTTTVLVCPKALIDGGPNNTGSILVDSFHRGGGRESVGLISIDTPQHDYTANDALTVAFHFQSKRDFDQSYGEHRGGIILKVGEFFAGVSNNVVSSQADRICMNVDAIADLGGADIGSQDCGSSINNANDGLAASSGNDSTPKNVWIHVVLEYDGVGNDYRIYFDNVLVGSEIDTVTGSIANGSNPWKIGTIIDAFDWNDFEMDNLMIFNKLIDSDHRARLGACDVPDSA